MSTDSVSKDPCNSSEQVPIVPPPHNEKVNGEQSFHPSETRHYIGIEVDIIRAAVAALKERGCVDTEADEDAVATQYSSIIVRFLTEGANGLHRTVHRLERNNDDGTDEQQLVEETGQHLAQRIMSVL